LFIELYETTYGICDHVNNLNPLASVQFNNSENFMKDYLYDGYLTTFLFKELNKKLGMSFDDFLNRPKFEIETIIRIVDETDKKKNRINESVMKDLENSVPKTPPAA
jgi:hypothetical protein